jgi:SET domain-containing protein
MTTTNQTEWVRIEPSGIHGFGGFAVADIPAEARVIEYVGERINKAESARRTEAGNPFVFELNDTTDIDGSVEWNLARHINHSCAPNCESRHEGEHIWIIALRDIRCGEEISFDYGYGSENYRDHPCRCGTANCFGYIVGEAHRAGIK